MAETVRTITVTLRSHIDDRAWERLADEISEEIEQMACDYAAAATNDNYQVDISFPGTTRTTVGAGSVA